MKAEEFYLSFSPDKLYFTYKLLTSLWPVIFLKINGPGTSAPEEFSCLSCDLCNAVLHRLLFLGEEGKKSD